MFFELLLLATLWKILKENFHIALFLFARVIFTKQLCALERL